MKRKIRKGLLLLLIAALILGLLFVVVSLVERNNNSKSIKNYKDENSSLYITINDKYYKEKDNIETILCVGLDTYDNQISDGYTNNNLADFITLLIVDKDTKQTLPIHINRDTMVDVDILGIGGKIAGKTYEQLSFSHSYGNGDISSLVNVKNAVSDLLNDIRIDYYLSITMSAVPTINDEVGGVEVLIEDDFSSIDSSLKQGEVVTLKGDQALTYVRTRELLEDSSNLARMKRQRIYLRSLYEQCRDKKGNDKFIYNLLSDINDDLVANATIYDLSDLGNMLVEYELLEAITLDGEAKKGEKFMEYYVSQDTIDDVCIKYLLDEVK